MTHTSNERAIETVLFAGMCARNFAKTESAITVQRAFRIKFGCHPSNDTNILRWYHQFLKKLAVFVKGKEWKAESTLLIPGIEPGPVVWKRKSFHSTLGINFYTECQNRTTAMAGSDVVQSGRPIFDDFFQHLWPYIGNNTANVVFRCVCGLSA
ncbi:hypothetical protein TNCV_2304701 [Trichonephila clavipes]|nr:hypothetical protein TNCV_2304701 [Trichonephila clavipes]